MTNPELNHENNCLMCAVRALTEGDPAATWTPTEIGQEISGVVLRQGEVSANVGPVPFVDLWQGGTGRVRVMAYPVSLRHALNAAAPMIGDQLQVRYNGDRTIEGGHLAGRTVKMVSVTVRRGH